MMDQRAVYQYAPPWEKGYTGLALDIHLQGGKLRFFDTLRGHILPGQVEQEEADAFTFEAVGALAGRWSFRILTIQEFKRRVFLQVEGGEALAAVLKSTEDLHEWYRKEFKI